MTPGSVFSVVNGLAFLAWLALIVRPGRPLVRRCVGQVVPVVFAVLYAVIITMRIGRASGDFGSLSGVAALFRDPWILLAGWVHYLTFDLLVGVWEVRDAEARKLPHWSVVPCLLMTFLFGPAGWLLYLIVRSIPAPTQNSPNSESEGLAVPPPVGPARDR